MAIQTFLPFLWKVRQEKVTVTFHHGDAPTLSNLVPNSRNVTWRERRGKRMPCMPEASMNYSLFTSSSNAS